MNARDLDRLHSCREAFWLDLGRLVAKHLNRLPARLHDDALVQMQEAASVYGSSYENYLKERI